MTQQIGKGIYAGIQYIVVEKEGKHYIGLDAATVARFTIAGANMKLLDDIGDKDPDEVMAALMATLPKR